MHQLCNITQKLGLLLVLFLVLGRYLDLVLVPYKDEFQRTYLYYLLYLVNLFVLTPADSF